MRTVRSNSEPKRNIMGRVVLPALCNVFGTFLILAVIAAMAIPALPRFTDYEIYNVISGSMEPEIPVGSLIIVEPRDPKTIEEGEIIAFTSNGTVVTHRVVDNFPFESEFITKGDANLEEDLSSVSYNDLIGSVKSHYDHLGAVLQYLTTAAGKVYLLLFVACGVMFQILAGRLRSE